MRRNSPADPSNASRTPEVSVVMPTRNRADLVRSAVSTVLEQAGVELELIIVDDASTDHTWDVLGDIAEGDARVRIIRLDERSGAGRARNVGVAEARASYVAFIDDDTEWHPTKLRRQLDAALADAEQIGVVYGPYLLMLPDGRSRWVGSAAAARKAPFRTLIRRNFIGMPTVLVRRDLLEAIGGFDESLPRLQDWDLFVRLAEVTKFAYVPDPLTRCRHVPGGISTQTDALVAAVKTLVAKYQARGLDARSMADWMTAHAHALMIGGAPSEGRRLHLRAMRQAPLMLHRLPIVALAFCGARVYRAAFSAATGILGALRWSGARKQEESWSTS